VPAWPCASCPYRSRRSWSGRDPAQAGQTIAGFGHGKILIVTDSIISKLGLLDDLTGL
jgi:hypothetical protein